jgi:hypothetical protein
MFNLELHMLHELAQYLQRGTINKTSLREFFKELSLSFLGYHHERVTVRHQNRGPAP